MRMRFGKPRMLAVVVLFAASAGLFAATFDASSSAAGMRSVVAHKAPLFVEVELVATNGQIQNVFSAGTKVEFWIKVFSPASGDTPLTSTALKSVTIGLPTGQTLAATYGKHGADSFWVAVWSIPASHPAGTVAFTAVAHAVNGAIGRYVPFTIAPSSLTVTG